ncbi:MAG: HRDC domain-containing protein [Bacteroidales bacterium]|nr:HRDC domain-containing protein [Bacteroidales bacterium]
MVSNPQIELARRYVEQTNVSVFLTGKAGTGKTTFLREVAAQCPKRHAIVAPTGVAAINAGGVTIHSFFQLPFDPYLPDVKDLVTEYQLPERRKSVSKNKINIIRTLELLIIDEISMVRADLLDAIDMTLRRYRRSSRPFGGLQLLLIGDVHQLSPVVTENERPFIEKVYPSPYFFSSKALQKVSYVTIELTTVYRQQDKTFVDILNHVRDNNIDRDTLRVLNSRVGVKQKDAITLTTHNRQADAINLRHMKALNGESRCFEAKVKGNYPEKSYPCDKSLELKVGERVMFIKNDTSGGHRYYNGKLANVTGFIQTDDGTYIEVVDDDGDIIRVGREVWENLKYEMDPKTNEIVQELDGTFSQYPLQAAWAVTIHKAQGLTFDRVVIDAADAFAFGQVYVALSRCRSLEGLSLSSPITSSVAFDDDSVSQFISEQPTFEQTLESADDYERQYRIDKLMELFDINELVHWLDRLRGPYNKLKNIYPDKLRSLGEQIDAVVDLQSVSERFKGQLMRLDVESQNVRARKGAEYYEKQLTLLNTKLTDILDIDIDNKETFKAIKEISDQLAEILSIKFACLHAVVKDGYSVAVVQHAKVDQLMAGEMKTTRKKGKKQSGNEDFNADLATLLRRWRASKAKEEGLPPYMVLQQKALQSIATNMPQTPSQLKQQLGVGAKTIEKYGKEILDIVMDFIASGQ